MHNNCQILTVHYISVRFSPLYFFLLLLMYSFQLLISVSCTAQFERKLTKVEVIIRKPQLNVLLRIFLSFSLSFWQMRKKKHADVFDICLLHSSVKIRNDELGIK